MQTTNHILMVRPASFVFNAETAKSNAFQKKISLSESVLKERILGEFDDFVQKLRKKGVHVNVIEDTEFPVKPDAVFPNNWGSFHMDGTVVLYPMLAENRRAERREDIIDSIGERYAIRKRIDLSGFEDDNRYLEGTGSIIFDHINKVAYACLAPRTDEDLFIDICGELGYKPIYFYSFDRGGKAIYHTNVMMAIGNGYAVICMESITDSSEQKRVEESLRQSDLEIIDISFEQMEGFCGNMLELEIPNSQNILAMSQTAYDSLKSEQKDSLEKYVELFPLSVHTIEHIGGGSVRCMISEIFLPKKKG